MVLYCNFSYFRIIQHITVVINKIMKKASEDMKRFIGLIIFAVMISNMVLPVSAVVNGVYVGSDDSGNNIINTTLQPSSEYYFPLLIGVEGLPLLQATNEDMARNHLVAYIVDDNNGLETAEIIEMNNLAYLYVKTGADDSTEEVSSRVCVEYKSVDSSADIKAIPTISVSYSAMSQEYLDSLLPGDIVEIDSKTPLVTSEQMEKLAKLNDYQPVTFVGEGWRYEAQVTESGDINFAIDNAQVEKIVENNPDSKLSFFSFSAQPRFLVHGKLAIDISDIIDEVGEDFYLYRYAYNNLYPLKYEHSQDVNEISINTNLLGSYVISSQPLEI